jgi:alginate O-acetyltransferase complex protein AlgI
MSFAGLDYYIFLFFVYFLFRNLGNKGDLRHVMLVFASLLFYTLGSGWHILLLIYSSVADHFLALKIQNGHDKNKSIRLWMWLSIVNNLSLLALFKYLGPILATLSGPWSQLGWGELPKLDLLLPIGISFYTFQTLSYTLDVSYKRIKARTRLLDTLTYVCFFPQLVAGPILRASHFLPQMKEKFSFDSTLFHQGIFFILLGLVKKIVIADTLGIFLVDPIYQSSSNAGAFPVMIGTFAYAFQIYNDFSGYSDIAIGSALILGFKVPINFDRPFSCNNPADFWNRWHISLSHWVRDYLFYPLMMKGGFLKGRVQINLFITTLIIGIWHGANLTFLLFGLLHALLAVLQRFLKNPLDKLKVGLAIFWFPVSWLVYWLLLNLGMLFFRADDLQHIGHLLGQLSKSNQFTFLEGPPLMWLAVILAVLTHLPRSKHWEEFALRYARLPLFFQLVITWLIFCFLYLADHLHQGRAAFIYFRF